MKDKVQAEELARAVCRGPICSHRAEYNRPCEFHLTEAKYLVKFLAQAGLEVTRTAP